MAGATARPGHGGCVFRWHLEGGLDRQGDVRVGGVQQRIPPRERRWRRLPKMPGGAGGPGVAVWTGRQVIGWGGTDCCGIASDEGAAYTPATNSWRSLPPSPLSARAAPGAWTGTELIVAGGNDGEGEHRFSDAAAYNPITRTWRSLPPMPVRRDQAVAVWDGREVLVIGGSGAGTAATRRRLQPGDRPLAGGCPRWSTRGPTSSPCGPAIRSWCGAA